MDKYILEVWDEKSGIDGKSIMELQFNTFESAKDYAGRISNPSTIWHNNCRVMDIG